MTFQSIYFRAQVVKMRLQRSSFRAKEVKEKAKQNPTRGIKLFDPSGVVLGEPFWVTIHTNVISSEITKASNMEWTSMPKLIQNQCQTF